MPKNNKSKLTPKQRPATDDSQLADLLKSISNIKVDRSKLRKYKNVRARLARALRAASPKSKVDLIEGIAVDLADFWEIAVEHQQRVKQLVMMKFPQDQERFIDLLYEFDIRLLMHSDWHVKRLRPRLRRLKLDLGLA